MSFCLLEGESVPDGIRRIAREQVEAAIDEISDRALPEPEKSISSASAARSCAPCCDSCVPG